MGLDLNNDYSSAKSKVRAYKTVNENKKNEKLLKNEKYGNLSVKRSLGLNLNQKKNDLLNIII